MVPVLREDEAVLVLVGVAVVAEEDQLSEIEVSEKRGLVDMGSFDDQQ